MFKVIHYCVHYCWAELSRCNERFIKNYDENNYRGYFFEADIIYPEKLFNLHKYLPFLPRRKKVNKVEKLFCNIEDKEKYVNHIRVTEIVLRKVQSNSI